MKTELGYNRIKKQWSLFIGNANIVITKKQATDLIEKLDLIENSSSMSLKTYKVNNNK